jgi:hypothetical protein
MAKKKTTKEMLEFISKFTKSCGQIPLGTAFGKYRNLMWDDERGVLLQTMTPPNGYIFPRLEEMSRTVIKAIYNDLHYDFAE